MTDEVTDCSNKEQFAICFRWIDEGFYTHEDVTGTDNVDNINPIQDGVGGKKAPLPVFPL